MTAPTRNDPAQFWAGHLERAEPDLPRSMVMPFAEASMGAEADALRGATYKSAASSGSTLATTTGRGSGAPAPVTTAIPELPSGAYSPD